MPSTSPGTHASPTPSTFAQIFPGAPARSTQAFTSFIYRFKRYVAYISGSQLNILSSPNALVQALKFSHTLVAIAAEAQSGKILVAGKKDVWILEPVTEGWTKIWWEKALLLQREDAGDETCCLSWGNDGEALVGGSRVLTLFSTLLFSRSGSPTVYPLDGETVEERRPLWTKPLASAVWQAEFSPSAAMIATRAQYARLVKIWRRLSFEEGLFDHTYLPHTGIVTHVQWRPLSEHAEERRGSGLSGRHDEESEVLFTIASDGLLRVWCAASMHDLDILTLHTTIDLISSIPQSPSLTIKGQSQSSSAPRYAVVLPSDQFSTAVNAVLGVVVDKKVNHSKELLKEMGSKDLDVVVSFDGQGRMSAWGLQSIGHKRRPDTPTPKEPIHISHAEGMHLRLPNGSPAVCGAWFQDDDFHLLTHTITTDEIAWWQGKVEAFFSPSAPGTERLLLNSRCCGHNDEVAELQRIQNGFVSRSSTNVIEWALHDASSLRSCCSFAIGPEVLAATVVRSRQVLLTVVPSAVELWNSSGSRLAKVPCRVTKGGVFNITRVSDDCLSGVFVQDDAEVAFRWRAELPPAGSKDSRLSLQSLNLSSWLNEDLVTFAVPVTMPFDVSKVCAICMTSGGRVFCALVPDDENRPSDLEPFLSFETGVEQPSLFAANAEFAALASPNRETILIVDLTDGYIEHRQVLEQPVGHLVCFTPKPRHNFLAVSHQTYVQILAQTRYESGLLIWNTVKIISTAGLGLDITSVAWLSNASLVVGAGNGVSLATAEIDLQDLDQDTRESFEAESAHESSSRLDLVQLSSSFKTPLSPWHPSLIVQLIYHGHVDFAATILRSLAQRLKFWSTGEDLVLDESATPSVQDADSSIPWLGDDTVADLREQLEEKILPRISRREQTRLKSVVEAIVYVREHARSLDANALRYLFSWKLQLLLADDSPVTSNGTASTTPELQSIPSMGWREISFAYHSNTQQALLDILILHHDNKLTWSVVRRLGIMAWLLERQALETVFEQLGQTAYRSEQTPDPVNASLYFLALHKKPTLLALWRMATWHKEQRTTMNFLKRDFSRPESRTAAKKNAYALMGKRRFEYAAAFFLLADDPASAISVLAGQCEDAQMGIAVARLYCGDGAPVLRQLLENRVFPQAQEGGDRWLMSWCHAVLLEKQEAAETLVAPLQGSKSWEQDDPQTLLLYRHLRIKPSAHEYDAVLRAARLLRRMGLWLLASDLVRRWEFKHEADNVGIAVTNGVHYAEPQQWISEDSEQPLSTRDVSDTPERPMQPPSMLDDFTLPVRTDEKAAREAKAAALLAKIRGREQQEVSVVKKEKQEPTQFHEPDANSLLDNFGF